MFLGAMNLKPGQELRQFDAYRDGEHKTASGRVTSNGWEYLGEFKAVLAAAKPEEIERWRQLEHPITHKIIQQGIAPFEIKAGDSLVCERKRYIVQTAPYNPGGLNHWTIYYCDERSDV